MLNKVQKAAFDLIQSDARFIYTLVDMQNNAKNINSNYVMMSIPYIGNFCGWCGTMVQKNWTKCTEI